MPRETPMEKGQRLVNEGRFTRLHERIYACRGDSGPTYLVCVPEVTAAQRVSAPVASCTCEARVLCAHIRGAVAIEKHVQAGGSYP